MSEQDEQPTARWTRDRLDAYATERGIDPAGYATKDDLLAAIEADGERTDAGGGPDEMAALGEADADTDDEPEPRPTTDAQRFRVLKAITLADGRTVMPGEEFTPDETFPARRTKQLVEQKYLRPMD